MGAQAIQEKQDTMLKARKALTEAVTCVNASKAEIDRCTAQLNVWQEQFGLQEDSRSDIVDGERYRLLDVRPRPSLSSRDMYIMTCLP